MAYIDKEKLIKDIESRRLVFKDTTTVEEALLSQGTIIRKAIEDAHAADVEEVKHGEWSIAIGYDIQKKVKCSVCELMNYEPTARCPHCGAKMDGGKNEKRG